MGKDPEEIRDGKEGVMGLHKKPCLFEEELP
jgi:hypothetical protein